MHQLLRSALRSVKRPRAAYRLLAETAQTCRKAVPLSSPDFPRVFVRMLMLNRRDRYQPDEAYRLGLLDPDFPMRELGEFSSRKAMVELEEKLTPPAWRPISDDKGIFYRYCNALGIPVPELYALFFRTTAGCSSSGLVLDDRDDWERFIGEDLPSEFVIKPARGYSGLAIGIYRRVDAGAFVDSAGTRCTAGDLYDTMATGRGFNSFVIQQRVKIHPELVRLSGTESVQTVRILTLVDRRGHFHLYHAHLRTIVGDGHFDNYRSGASGNLMARVCLDSGLLHPAVGPAESGAGVRTVHEHPNTGVAFDGFELPMWQQACELVRRAAFELLPSRAIGWDIALTADGPVVIEANWNADPPVRHRRMEIVRPLLSEG